MHLESIGVVVPTFNEANHLPKLLADLQRLGFTQICIVDANSSDETVHIAKEFGIFYFTSTVKNKAVQLNIGANKMKTEYFLFLHADVRIINQKADFLIDCLKLEDFCFGNFKLAFDSNHWFLKLNEKFSYFKTGAFQFGDQGLLVKSELFKKVGGYNESMPFMEGNDLIRRLRKKNKFEKMNGTLLVSARKYEEVGVYRLQFSYFLIYFLTRLGIKQSFVKKLFKRVFS
jgi:rSAM/selenodomain-associated transferase 2